MYPLPARFHAVHFHYYNTVVVCRCDVSLDVEYIMFLYTYKTSNTGYYTGCKCIVQYIISLLGEMGETALDCSTVQYFNLIYCILIFEMTA